MNGLLKYSSLTTGIKRSNEYGDNLGVVGKAICLNTLFNSNYHSLLTKPLTIYLCIPVRKSTEFRSRPQPQKWKANPANTGLFFNMVVTGFPTKTTPLISSDWSSFHYILYIVPKLSMTGRMKA